MKKNVIAIMMSLVMAAGSLGSVPVFAAETTATEAMTAVEAIPADEVLEEQSAENTEEIENTGDDVSSEEAYEEEPAAPEDEPASENASEEGATPAPGEEIVVSESKEAMGSVVDSGTCGADLTWSLEDGTLTISGTGEMEDYAFMPSAPWYDYRKQIFNIMISEGVTSIGKCAFLDCSVTDVSIPDSVTDIRESAFEE